MKFQLCLHFFILLFVTWAPESTGQTYPNRPITIIVGAPPGGALDTSARLLAPELSKELNTNVIIQNRPGVHAIVAAQTMLNSKSDGYTLLKVYSGFHVISPHLAKLPFDTMNDFQPIAKITKVPTMLAVKQDSKFQSINDIIEYSKNNPKKLTFGAINGNLGHIGMEILKQHHFLDVTHVPYKGGALATQDLLAGQITISMQGISPLLPHVQTGRLKGLLVTSNERWFSLPNVPTAKELGFKNFVFYDWFGLYTNRDVPNDIIALLSSTIENIVKQDSFQSRAKTLGSAVSYENYIELKRSSLSEFENWRDILKDLKIQIE